MNYSEIHNKILCQTSQLSNEENEVTEASLKKLEIDTKSQFGKIYLTCDLEKLSSTSSYWELESAIPIVTDGSPSPLEETVQFVREAWDIPKQYIPFTSTEGEGCYLYDKETEAIYNFDLGDRDKLISGQLKPDWPDFYSFMEFYLS